MRVMRWLRRLSRGYATGGAVSQRVRAEGEVPCVVSEVREITDPDEAEALGLTVDAERILKRGSAA